MSQIRPECLVSGALALTLQVSRLFGLAPLRMSRQRCRWRISVSPILCVYSYLFLFVLNAGGLMAIVLDLNLEPESAVYLRTPAASVNVTVGIIITMAVSTVGVYGSPARMKHMIENLKVIEKIHMKPSNDRESRYAETKGYIAAMVVFLVFNLWLSTELHTINEAINEGRDLKVVCLYSCIFVQYILNTLLLMQFTCIAMRVRSALKYVNDSLNDIIYIVDLPTIPNLSTVIPEEVDNTNTTIPANAVNILTETNATRRARDKVRRLTISFGTICDVIRQVNTSYEKVMLLLIVAFFYNLVVTSCYFIEILFRPEIRSMTFFVEGAFCVMYAIQLVIAVEPGHRTEREMERTAMLVSQLLRRVTSARDSLALELDLFYKQIVLNKVSYSPLGMFTLTRPLLAAICGGITTYLIIILQYQALDLENW